MTKNHKLGLWILTSLVVGNMVGSGIFMLPRSLAEAASPAGVLGAWILTGFGVLMTALVFGNLAIRKPHLTGGPQIYAKELFPPNTKAAVITGFMASWGYWIGNLAGNIAIITTFTSYLSTFFPILTNQTEWFTVGSITIKVGNGLTFIVSSLLLWGIHWILLHGVDQAGKLNLAATIAKVVGFVIFIVIGIFSFQKGNILPLNGPRMSESGETLSLFGQINRAALTTLWAFIGMESAVVFASRAKRQKDVKRATIFGLLIALILYIAISTLVMGMLTQTQLIQSEKPLIDAIETVLGPIGGKLLAALGLISLVGSGIGWVMLSAEVPYQAAKQGIFIQAFQKENKQGIPTFSMIITNGIGQLFILSTISNSISQAFDFVIYIATLSYLIPYFIASIFQLKLVFTGETYVFKKQQIMDGIIASFATIYSIWVIFAGTRDMKTFIFGMILLASGLLFIKYLPLTYIKRKKYTVAEEIQ